MTVYLVLDAWSSDPFEPRAVFSTKELAERFVGWVMECADDYEEGRHNWQIQPFELDRPYGDADCAPDCASRVPFGECTCGRAMRRTDARLD